MSDVIDPRDTERHPRRARRLVGQEEAERRLVRAYLSGRLHHAWLLAGPRGVGKATLAYRFARFILCNPDPEELTGNPAVSLDVPSEHAAAQLVTARSHPDLLVIERPFDPKAERVKSIINVEEARGAAHFFSLTPALGGWRVCIVDAADDLNKEAANALLKILEEPPSRSLFVIVAHAPGRLLATIRSRAIRLDLRPLVIGEVVEVLKQAGADQRVEPQHLEAIAALSAGSPGRALELVDSVGARLFLRFREAAKGRPPFARRPLLEIAGALQRREAGDDFPIFADLMSDWIGSIARRTALDEGASAARPWAQAHHDIGHSIRRANALNLDRRQVLLEAFATVEEAARLSRG